MLLVVSEAFRRFRGSSTRIFLCGVASSWCCRLRSCSSCAVLAIVELLVVAVVVVRVLVLVASVVVVVVVAAVAATTAARLQTPSHVMTFWNYDQTSVFRWVFRDCRAVLYMFLVWFKDGRSQNDTSVPPQVFQIHAGVAASARQQSLRWRPVQGLFRRNANKGKHENNNDNADNIRNKQTKQW